MEMLVVLFVISMLVVIFPLIQLGYEMQTIKQLLLQTQVSAVNEHREKMVKISSNSMLYDHKRYTFMDGMDCAPTTLYYYANGNVSQAKTIRCNCQGKQKSLVIELGSGAIYVR